MRISPILVLLAASLGCVGAANSAGPSTVKLDIPAQSIDAALNEFARQSGLQVVLQTREVEGILSKPIVGTFTPEDALGRLLANTGLSFQYLNARTVAVRPKSAAGKDVETSMPSDHLRPVAEGSMRLARATTLAAAQTVEAPAATPDSAEIEVQSTRIDGIQNKGIIPTGPDAPLYYNVIDRDTIDRLGITSMEELFRIIPQTTNPQTTLQSAPGNVQVTGGTVPNISRISLRGFPSAQTVILVNGRALPRSGTSTGGGADISRIPIAAIERVEILPASGSALYGAGAIGGAVNIILRKSYQGEDMTAYFGTSTEGGADEYRLTYLRGGTFREGRTDVTLTFDYQHRGPLYMGDRDYLERVSKRYPAGSTLMMPNGFPAFEQLVLPAMAGPRATIVINSPTGDLGIPGAPGVRYATVPVGTSPTEAFTLTPESFVATAGQVGEGNRYDRISIYNPVDNYTLDAQLEHTFSRKLRGYAGVTLRYLRSDYSYQQPGSPIQLSATDPMNPFRTDVIPGFEGRPVTVYFDPVDLPDPSSLEERTNVRLTLGLSGSLNPKWDWSFDVTGDQNRSTNDSNNRTNYFGSLQALSPAGLPNAQPAEVRRAFYPLLADHSAHPFTGNVDEYWNSLRFSDFWVRNVDVLGRLSGELMKLPAGNWQASVMGQYTYFTYSSSQALGTSPGMISLLGLTGSVAGSGRDFTDQNRGTTGLSLETVVPIIGGQWRPIPIHALDLNFGARYERAHSTGDYVADPNIKTDDSKTATTMVAGLKLQFVPDLALRASYTEGFYPPDWNEVTQPVQPYMFPGVIPDPLRGNTTQGVEFEVVNGGNPDLKPEHSYSTNVGLIFKPRQLPGLTLMTDYWRTKKRDGIQRVIFFDAIARASEYAHLITRAEPTAEDIANGWAGIIVSFDQRTANIALQETEGVDLQVRYDIEAGDLGSFFLNTNVSFTNSFMEQPTANSSQTNIVGGSGPVRWRGYSSLNWTRDRMGVTLTANYVGHRYTSTTAPSRSYPTASGLDGERIPGYLLWDTQFTYEVPYDMNATGLRAWTTGVKWTLGVLNLFNKEPALLSDAAQGFYNRYQDPRQRYVYMTLRKSF